MKIQGTITGRFYTSTSNITEVTRSGGQMNYEIKPLPMICGSTEAESRKYHKYECSKGVYLVADQENSADNVYFHNPRDTRSEGFGGREITFPLVNGGVYIAKGPWHTNADSLYTATGIDIRDKYATRVVIGKDRIMGSHPCSGTIVGVVYMEEDWVISTSSREREILRTLPPGEYFVYSQGQSGSCMGWNTIHDDGLIENGKQYGK
jgi:hypothetical protein